MLLKNFRIFSNVVDAILNKASFVRSIRGAQGGYVLTRQASEYTVGDILRLTEGELTPVDCAANDGAYCENRKQCVTINVWNRLYAAINDIPLYNKVADKNQKIYFL